MKGSYTTEQNESIRRLLFAPYIQSTTRNDFNTYVNDLKVFTDIPEDIVDDANDAYEVARSTAAYLEDDQNNNNNTQLNNNARELAAKKRMTITIHMQVLSNKQQAYLIK